MSQQAISRILFYATIYLPPPLRERIKRVTLHGISKMKLRSSGLLLLLGKNLAVSLPAFLRDIVTVRISRIAPDGRYPLPFYPPMRRKEFGLSSLWLC